MGKEIKIYLVDGTPYGMRKIKISNWSGISLTAFKNNLSKFEKRKELSKPCVYFLIGDVEESVCHKRIYIGETENFKKRLDDHMKNKDFWNQCILFTSIDDNFNKAHVKWLESHFYSHFRNFSHIILENASGPKKSKLSESDTSSLNEYSKNVYLILNALGVYTTNTKEANVNKKIKERFHMSEAGVDAYMEREQEKYKVLEGAVIREKQQLMYQNKYKGAYAKRNSLLNEGFLVEQDNGMLLLKKDVCFKSPSAASVFCAGSSSNGRTAWKNKDGKTLTELEEEEIQ